MSYFETIQYVSPVKVNVRIIVKTNVVIILSIRETWRNPIKTVTVKNTKAQIKYRINAINTNVLGLSKNC